MIFLKKLFLKKEANSELEEIRNYSLRKELESSELAIFSDEKRLKDEIEEDKKRAEIQQMLDEEHEEESDLYDYGIKKNEIESFLKVAKKIDLTYFVIELIKFARTDLLNIREYFYSGGIKPITHLDAAISILKQKYFKNHDVKLCILESLHSCERDIHDWEDSCVIVNTNSYLYSYFESARKTLNLASYLLSKIEKTQPWLHHEDERCEHECPF